jgi:hypothetical protein
MYRHLQILPAGSERILLLLMVSFWSAIITVTET